MRIGIPKEIKPREGRVALIPSAAAELVNHGHEVYMQAGAGISSGYPDLDYRNAGVRIVEDAVALYGEARLVLKVKEPVAAEYGLLRDDHVLFCFLHLAANPELALVLRDKRLTAIGFETVESDGKLPLLAPMSEIAGRLAVQIGATLLHTPYGGRGVLLGGLASAERGHVVVLGAGNVGRCAVSAAAETGARVTVFARSRESLVRVHALGHNVTALPAYQSLIADAVLDADLLIGAVLVPGARAPQLVSAELVAQMRPGSVIVDVAVDQGGCVETIRATDYDDPIYVEEDVVHFGVTNMPGAVPRTSSQALSNVLVPYVLRLAGKDALSDETMRGAVNVDDGRIVHPAVADALA
ncbi:MAG: alanine dehydrogenase [Acidiferrobacterales bacterium]